MNKNQNIQRKRQKLTDNSKNDATKNVWISWNPVYNLKILTMIRKSGVKQTVLLWVTYIDKCD